MMKGRIVSALTFQTLWIWRQVLLRAKAVVKESVALKTSMRISGGKSGSIADRLVNGFDVGEEIGDDPDVAGVPACCIFREMLRDLVLSA